MKLPKFLTTVTLFSKFLALSMLVIVPILAYFYGEYRQAKQDSYLFYINQKVIDDNFNATPTPSYIAPTLPEPIDTNTWQSYSDPYIHMNMQIPNNWHSPEYNYPSGGIDLNFGYNFFIFFGSRYNQSTGKMFTVQQVIDDDYKGDKSYKSTRNITKEQIVVDGKTATKITYEQVYTDFQTHAKVHNKLVEIFIAKDNELFWQIGYGADVNDKQAFEVYQKIIDSIVLID